ncbi:baeRF3 domain-containing protein [Rhodopirellula sallentina]|nr:hypothetical protein [Rhodopirellula sallentina]
MSTATNELTTKSVKPSDLKRLAKTAGSPCVSILMRTHRSGPETLQGAIRLKNSIATAEEKLTALGHAPSILDPIRSLINNSEFWQNQRDGLAIYLTADGCQIFSVNRTIPNEVIVGDAFLIAPLVPQHGAAGEYFALSLTWDDAKLYRSNEGSLQLVKTDLLPASYYDLVIPRDPEVSLQHTSHRSVGNAPGTSTAMFHGHGEGEDKIEADRDQYLSLVGNLVASEIYNTHRPLVVVATTETCGKFESTTEVTADAKVEGSPAQWTEHELFEKVQSAVDTELEDDKVDFFQRFGTAASRSQGSSDIQECMTAAQEGKVDTLVVATEKAGRGDINRLALEVLRTGGNVFQSDSDNIDSSGVAAIYRY